MNDKELIENFEKSLKPRISKSSFPSLEKGGFYGWYKYKLKKYIEDKKKQSGELTSRDDLFMNFGSLIHKAILEPDTLGEIMVVPSINWTTKDGKAQKEEIVNFVSRDFRKNFVTSESEFATATNIAKSIKNSEHSWVLDEANETESYHEVELSDGIILNGFIDLISHEKKKIIDIKTAEFFDDDIIYMTIRNSKFEPYVYRQISMCDDYDYEWLLVETAYPYRTRIVGMSPVSESAIFKKGKSLIKDFTEAWKDFSKTGKIFLERRTIELKRWDV